MREPIEQLITFFEMHWISSPIVMNSLVRTGYELTGNKFSIGWEGSRGYLDRFVISCEGWQSAKNYLTAKEALTKKLHYRAKIIYVYHSEEYGVRISTSKSKPLTIDELRSLYPDAHIKAGVKIHMDGSESDQFKGYDESYQTK